MCDCLALSCLAGPSFPASPKWCNIEQTVGKGSMADVKKAIDAISHWGVMEVRPKAMMFYRRILLNLERMPRTPSMNSVSGFRRGMQLQIYATAISRLL